MKRLGFLFLFGWVVSAGTAQAATYYVATSGNDGASCAQAQTQSTPKKTLNNAVSCLRAGDTLLVRGGTYAEALIENVPSGTSWSSKVRIAAFPGETVWMRPNGADFVVYFSGTQQYIEFDGINMESTNTVHGTIKLDGSAAGSHNPHHIRFQNAESYVAPSAPGGDINTHGLMHILLSATAPNLIGGNEFLNLKVHGTSSQPSYTYAFYVQSGDNLIDGCEMYNLAVLALQIYNSYGSPAPNNIIRNNRIHDISQSAANYAEGMEISHVASNTQVYNNIIYNISVPYASNNSAIFVQGGSGAKIYNNTLYNNKTDGINVSDGASSTEVRNNIVYAGVNGRDFVNTGSGTNSSTNLMNVDPMFVNPVGGDFHLKVGSPAINAGAYLAVVATDIAGVVRPQGSIDVGAYQHSGGLAPPNGLRIVRD